MDIRFVIAFKVEAEPLIEFYGLKQRLPKGLYPVYENEAYALVISGMGKNAAAAASSYLHSVTAEKKYALWVNLGIAGHDNFPIGKTVVAHKIINAATQRTWYPPQTVKHDLLSADLITVDAPEKRYQNLSMYDMEAAGFYEVASRCSSMELVQCCKVISDNQESPMRAVKPDQFKHLMVDSFNDYNRFISSMHHWSSRWDTVYDMPGHYADFINNWSFSVTRQHELKRQLQRWQALSGGEPCTVAAFEQCRNASEVLRALEKKISDCSINFIRHD